MKIIFPKKEDIIVDFNFCHNCKIKKPTELMVKCKNKDSVRPIKTFQTFNLNQIRSISFNFRTRKIFHIPKL